MKRGIVATFGLAFAVVVGLGLFGTAARVSANHIADPDEITITQTGGPVYAVGTDVEVKLSITTSTTPFKSVQWELAYGANLSFAAAATYGPTGDSDGTDAAKYTCNGEPGGITLPTETDGAPVESVLIPAVANNLGGGSFCASGSGSFTGIAQTGSFVFVRLRCLAVGNTFVSMRPATQPANPANDAFFGTVLGDAGGAQIATTLENQAPIPGFGSQAAVGLACATPVDYSVQKTPPSQNVSGDAPNNVANQTISIANPDAAAHAVFLSDTVPAGLTVTNIVPGPGASCTLGPAPAAAAGPTPPYYGPGPFSAAGAGTIVCIGSAPAGGTLSAVITTTAGSASDCSTKVNTVQGGPGDGSTSDTNLANNGAGAQIVVDCPNLDVTKTCVDNDGPPAFTDDTFNCTITVTNDGPATGSIAHGVVMTDVFSGGETCTVNCGPYPAVNIAPNGSAVTLITVKMPSVAGVACDTANATQTAPGPANVADPDDTVCQTVKSKFPTINGFAKDTGVTPTNPDGSLNQNFTFTVGNIFLCKPLGGAPAGGLPAPGAFSGAGESACGVFKIAEIIQEPMDIDSCVDDDDLDGKGCAGNNAFGPAPWQAQTDGCLNIASDYIPGQTQVDCNGGEKGEGLGAAEFQIKFDDKLFQSPTFDCLHTPTGAPAVLGSTGRLVQPQVSIITENWVMFGCVTKDPAHPIPPNPPGTCVPASLLPSGFCQGPDISQGAILGTITLNVQPDLFSRMRPAKENGVSTNVLDENCEKADTLGQPFNEFVGTFGENKAPSGGLSVDCKDAALTIRMLEGDINLDCRVDIVDDQGIAFRYGQFFGQLNYNRFFDLEPNIAPDFDIDIKDVQTVFGRNGSTCGSPIPNQPPLSTIPDP